MKKTWDKLNSTYWWKMYLLPQFDTRKNASQNSPMVGYSQSEGWAEAQDKHQLLKNKIINPHVKCNWINKCSRIEIFERKTFIINSHLDHLVVELYPNDFVVYNQAYGNKSSDLIFWLKQLYNEILAGTHKEYILSPAPPKVNYKVSNDNKIDTTKHTFRTNGDLQVYCTKLKAQGINDNQIMNFYRKSVEIMERNGYK